MSPIGLPRREAGILVIAQASQPELGHQSAVVQGLRRPAADEIREQRTVAVRLRRPDLHALVHRRCRGGVAPQRRGVRCVRARLRLQQQRLRRRTLRAQLQLVGGSRRRLAAEEGWRAWAVGLAVDR